MSEWYDMEIEPHDEDILNELLDKFQPKNYDSVFNEFSIKYPELLFTLIAQEDENGDIWVRYYKNGKCQFAPAIITFDEFDEKKLK